MKDIKATHYTIKNRPRIWKRNRFDNLLNSDFHYWNFANFFLASATQDAIVKFNNFMTAIQSISENKNIAFGIGLEGTRSFLLYKLLNPPEEKSQNDFIDNEVKATKTIHSDTINITMVDENENEFVIEMNNYKTDITFDEIVTALSVGLSSSYWISSAGYKFIGVKKVDKVIIDQEIEDLL